MESFEQRIRSQESVTAYENESPSRAPLDSAPVGIGQVGPDGQFLAVNSALCRMLGYSRDELLKRRVRDLTFPADRAAEEVLFAALKNNQIPSYSIAKRCLTKSGTFLWLRAASSAAFGMGVTAEYRLSNIETPAESRPVEHPSQENEKRLRDILDALPVAVYTTDAAGTITYYNQAAVEFSGRTPKPGSDEWCVTERLYRPDGTPLPHSECPMAISLKEDRKVWGVEAIAERPDGTRIPFLPYPTPLHDSSGALIGGVNTLLDVSDRKGFENANRKLNQNVGRDGAKQTRELAGASTQLLETEHSFRILVEGVTDYAVFLLDRKGYITSWNPGAERIKGYSASEIIGQHFSRFYSEEERRKGIPQAAIEIAARLGKYEAEGWRIRKDGSAFWATVVIDAIRDKNGQLIGFAKVTRDVTERKKAEDALVESEQMARAVIDKAFDGFAQMDKTGVIVEWNSAAQTIFGWSREEAIGSTLGSLIVAPSDQPRYRQEIDRLRRGGENAATSSRWQIKAAHRSGHSLSIELAITTLERRGGPVFTAYMRDITDKIVAEERIRHAHKMEAVGQLTGGVAHDFNNVLMAIIGNLDVLITILPPQSRARKYVETAVRAAWRGSRLTEQLLTFSRRQEICPETVNINDLLRNIELLCEKIAGDGIEIIRQLNVNIWACRIDAAQFETAVLNLFANARDAMSGSGRLTVKTENFAIGAGHGIDLTPGEYVLLSVSDTGCGMDAEVSARAFDPFFTTKEVGKGTGLGLSQVYGFAAQSGGAACIDSELNVGTTVRLYLPKTSGKVTYGTLSKEDIAPRIVSAAAILVVEDDLDVRETIVEMLSDLGYRTLVATSGPDALAILRNKTAVDLLFSDVIMPAGMNGIELARTARRLRPELKILLSSGYAGDTPLDAIRAEFQFIGKPYRRSALGRKLNELLSGIEAGPAV